MFTTQHARKIRSAPERPRKPLKAPHRQLAFRNEHIATTQTTLILKPKGDAQSEASLKIIDDEDDSVKFTVTGKKYSDRSCREFRDESGLPLFEIHQKGLFTHAWSISLPGSDQASIAKAAPRLSFTQQCIDDFSLSFENQAAIDGKSEEDKKVQLVIERNGSSLPVFDVVDRDRRVAVVRESIKYNKILPVVKFNERRYKPILEITVTSGTDISLAAAIAVIISDWVFK